MPETYGYVRTSPPGPVDIHASDLVGFGFIIGR